MNLDFKFRFIQKFGTHVVVGVKMGGKDVVCFKQLYTSSLQAIEVQRRLKEKADGRFLDRKVDFSQDVDVNKVDYFLSLILSLFLFISLPLPLLPLFLMLSLCLVIALSLILFLVCLSVSLSLILYFRFICQSNSLFVSLYISL